MPSSSPFPLKPWLHELAHVWRTSYRDLGLISAACAGVWMLTAYFLRSYLPHTLESAALHIIAGIAIAWVYAASHLVAHQHSEALARTSLRATLASTGLRAGAVLPGALLYLLTWEYAAIYERLGLPDALLTLFTIAGALIGGVMLPYIAVLMIEGRSPGAALQRTVALARGRWPFLLVCFLLMWAAFITTMAAGFAMVAGGALATELLTPTLIATQTQALGIYGFKAIIVAAWLFLVFFSLPLFVIIPHATYRLLTRMHA